MWLFNPDEEVFRLITNLVRATGTHLYGRRMYQTMMVWETDPHLAAESPLRRDFAEIWQAADKLVYSRTLEDISTRRTQIVRNFDPEAIQQLKKTVEQDVLIWSSSFWMNGALTVARFTFVIEQGKEEPPNTACS